MSISRKAYSVVGVLLLAEYLAQVFLIATAVFTIERARDDATSVYSAFKRADAFSSAHVLSGDVIVNLTTLVLIGLAIASGFPRRTVLLTLLLWFLLFAQFALASAGSALVSGLHGLNGLVMIGLAGWLTASTWAFRRDAPPRRGDEAPPGPAPTTGGKR
jgi:hypothetical protein